MNSGLISYWTVERFWWRCPELNWGPAAYESAALPTELHRHNVTLKNANDSRRLRPVSTDWIGNSYVWMQLLKTCYGPAAGTLAGCGKTRLMPTIWLEFPAGC